MQDGEQSMDGTDEPDVEAHRLDTIEIRDGEDDREEPEPPGN